MTVRIDPGLYSYRKRQKRARLTQLCGGTYSPCLQPPEVHFSVGVKRPAYFRIFPSKTPSTMADNTTTPVGGTIQHGGMPSTSITVQEGTSVVAEFQLQLVAQDLSVNTVGENGVLAAATTRHRRKFKNKVVLAGPNLYLPLHHRDKVSAGTMLTGTIKKVPRQPTVSYEIKWRYGDLNKLPDDVRPLVLSSFHKTLKSAIETAIDNYIKANTSNSSSEEVPRRAEGAASEQTPAQRRARHPAGHQSNSSPQEPLTGSGRRTSTNM